jgi:hypothetical protein
MLLLIFTGRSMMSVWGKLEDEFPQTGSDGIAKDLL